MSAHRDHSLAAGTGDLPGGVLDRIDELVPPGSNVNPADAGYQPPALTDPSLRLR